MILPRQARDKHRESTQKRERRSLAGLTLFDFSGLANANLMRVFWKLSPLLYLFLVPDGNPKDIVEQIDQELNIEDDDDDDDVKLSDAPPPAEPAKGAAAAAGVADQKSPFSWSALGALAFIAIMPLLITSMELSITYYALPVLGAIIVPCVEIYSDNKQGGGGTYLGKTALFAKPFYSKNRVLAKTGSGQT